MVNLLLLLPILKLGLWLSPALFNALASSCSGTFYLLNASLNLSRYHHEVEQELKRRLSLSQDLGLILKLGLPCFLVRLSERKEFATATSDTVKAWWSALLAYGLLTCPSLDLFCPHDWAGFISYGVWSAWLSVSLSAHGRSVPIPFPLSPFILVR